MELDSSLEAEQPRLGVVARLPVFGQVRCRLEVVVEFDERFVHRALRWHDEEVVLRDRRVHAVFGIGVAKGNA